MSPEPNPPASVVVLRYSHVGDIVLTTPALEALKKAWPESRILFVLEEGFGDLVRHHPAVDGVVERGKREGDVAFGRRLRALGPGAFLDLHGWGRNLLVRPLSGARRRAVFQRRPWIDDVLVGKLHVRRYRSRMPISDRYHAAVEKLVGRSLPRGDLRHFVGPEDEAVARERMASAGLDPARDTVGMAPGSNFETKRWPVERYAQLAKRASDAGLQVVLTGSAREGPLAAAVRESAPGAADLTGRLSLGSLGGVISLCRAFVANDSGPMHMSRALGVPTLAFFGSTDPAQFEFDGHGLMYAAVECAPCSLWGLAKCPKGHFRCMLDLDVDAAWRVLERLLKSRPVGFVHA